MTALRTTFIFLLISGFSFALPEVGGNLKIILQERSEEVIQVLIQPSSMMEKSGSYTYADQNANSYNSKGVAINGKGVPVNSKGAPVNSKGIPTNSKGMPVNQKGIPRSSKGIPVNQKGAPTNGKGIPVNKGNSAGSQSEYQGPILAHPSTDPQLQARLRQLFEYSKSNFLSKISANLERGLRVVDSFWINETILLEGPASLFTDFLSRTDIQSMSLNTVVSLPVIQESRQEFDFKFPYGVKTLRAPQVHQEFKVTGKGIRVGILDTGYRAHDFLNGKVTQAKSFIEGENVEDGHGHGTHCLGAILGSNTDEIDHLKSGLQLTGTAPGASGLVAKVFSNDGSSDLSTILRGLQWLADPDGSAHTRDHAHIISGSFGDPPTDFAQQKPLWDAILRLRRLGIACLFAAGNEGPKSPSINVPGAFPQSISIGALSQSGELASYSSRGTIEYEDVEYQKPDFVAPGSSVLSLGLNNDFRVMTGTSMATPYAAGVFALVKEANPDLDVDRLRKIVELSAVDLLEPGKDSESGFGLIDAYTAVRLAKNHASLQGVVDGIPARARIKLFRKDRFGSFQLVQTLLTKLTGGFETILEAGTYKIVVSAWGHLPLSQQFTLVRDEKKKVYFQMEESKVARLSLQVLNEFSEPLPVRIVNMESPLELKFQEEENFSYAVETPMDLYTLSLESQGYERVVTHVLLDDLEKSITILMRRVPPVLIVDSSPGDSLERFVVEALKTSHQILNRENLPDNLDPYNLILWGTGAQGHNNLNEEEKILLRNFVYSGGSVLFHGQDFIYSLQDDSSFLKESLGLRLKEDDSGAEWVQSGLLKSRLNHEYSAANQLFPDSLEPLGEAKASLQYDNGDVAGVLHPFGNGFFISLGFGLEGLSPEAREVLLQVFLKDLEPTPTRAAQRLENYQQSNPALYKKYIESLKTHWPDLLGAIQELDREDKIWTRKGLSPVKFQKIHEMNRRKIFDELYGAPEPRDFTY